MSTQKKSNFSIKSITLCAVMIAVSFILGKITLFTMPQGGSVTPLSMVPIILCGYILGLREGVIAGICLGLLKLFLGGYFFSPIQVIIDYPLAFGALGLSGLFKNKKNSIIPAYIVSLLGRYFFAVLSGVVFFRSYAPKGWDPLLWSLWYNATYLAIEAIISIAILLIPTVNKNLERLKNTL